MDAQEKLAYLRDTNDNFRRTFIGGAVIVSPQFEALDEELKSDILWRIRNFDAFAPNEEWDPENEHAHLTFDYRGYRILVLIDYWARDMTSYTHDPYDPAETQLVMTIEVKPCE